MTLRHRPRYARVALTRVAIGAAASLAVVASTGVTAGAVEDVMIDDPDATSQAPTETADPTAEDTEAPVVEEFLAEDPATTPPAPSAPSPQGTDAAEAPVVALAPNYGTQKVRVGVQLADGSWVPEGTVLTGSTVRVTITGGVDGDEVPLPDESFECVTGDGIFDDDQTQTSSCNLDGPFGLHALGAGQTLTVQHLSSPEGIAINPVPLVVEPCETAGPAGSPCGGDSPFASIAEALVEVTGTPPTARDDAATTPFNTPVVINVLANDDSGNGAPLTGLSVAEPPANGTAEVIGEFPPVVEPEPPVDSEEPVIELAAAPQVAAAPVAAAPSPVQVVYTPNAGFVGTDTFVYAVTTPNGTAFATVTVQVLGVASPTAVTATRTGALPNVGGSDATLVGLGALLVAAGATTVAAGRRRTEVRDLLA